MDLADRSVGLIRQLNNIVQESRLTRTASVYLIPSGSAIVSRRTLSGYVVFYVSYIVFVFAYAVFCRCDASTEKVDLQ